MPPCARACGLSVHHGAAASAQPAPTAEVEVDWLEIGVDVVQRLQNREVLNLRDVVARKRGRVVARWVEARHGYFDR